MLDLLSGFVAELRSAGLTVSIGEHVDAARAIDVIDLGDRELLRVALRSSLVKRGEHEATFNRLFALYFGYRRHEEPPDRPEDVETPGGKAPSPAPSSGATLSEQLLEALRGQDQAALVTSAAAAVDRYAGIEAGRPVGSAYYLYRTLRHLQLDELEQRLAADLTPEGASALDERLAADAAAERVEQFKETLEEEIVERLVHERGVEVMAKASRAPLLEDVDVMQANRDELAKLEHALIPLSRKLAARLSQRRRRRRRGPVDIRRTIRESLSTGGVPLDIRFRPPHPTKPELVVLADMSGSVASFARFTLLLVHALNGEFSTVRSFVFIDGVDEVTQLFDECDSPTEAADRIAAEANMVAADGHSDYGRVFQAFQQRYLDSLSPRTTVLVLGDARNNYHLSHAEALEAVARRVKRVYWLNPEPQAYWASGDSVLGAYAEHCDEIYECRTLRQLEQFVGGLP